MDESPGQSDVPADPTYAGLPCEEALDVLADAAVAALEARCCLEASNAPVPTVTYD